MGKQGYDKRTALANALNTSGVAKAPPPKKELAQPQPITGKGQGKRKKDQPDEPQQKTKKDIEEEQRKLLQDNERQRAEFYQKEAAKKIQEKKGADSSVTYVEDKDTRKPKAVSDISDYWKADLGILPFTPDDNVGLPEALDDVDPQDRLEFLQMFDEKLQRLLRLRFHVFWSQFIYDEKVRRCLDSYLRFGLRTHDVVDGEQSHSDMTNGHDLVAVEEQKVARDISRRVLATFVRLSRPQESPSDFISDGKFAQVIYEHSIFDVPKLIDLCAIYGDSNRITVTKIVHSVFALQPLYKDDFSSVVQHMISGLHQCCEPLQQAARSGSMSSGASKTKSPDLSVEDCLAFLPDILSCFNAIFCFFPQDLVEQLLAGRLDVPASASDALGEADGGVAPIPMADLMVLLHDALMAMQESNGVEPPPEHSNTVMLLSRLLGLVLGFRMAPKRGASAFEELLEWLRSQADRSALLLDLGKHGLESTAMEWLASGLVDDAQLDYLEQLCGPVLPTGERRRGRRAAAPVAAKGPVAAGSGGATSSSSKPVGADASANDKAKVREVREVVGTEYGEGYILQCLMHFGGSVPAVVGAIFDGSLPPQIKALPRGLSIAEAISAVSAAARRPESSSLSAEDKKRVLGQAVRLAEVPAEADGEGDDDVYNDDVDDSIPLPRGFSIGANESASEEDDAGEDGEVDSEDDDGEPRWRNSKGGQKGGKGKGRGFKGPVQGQTIQARRKEENKARVANHNRRDGAMRKMMKGMV